MVKILYQHTASNNLSHQSRETIIKHFSPSIFDKRTSLSLSALGIEKLKVILIVNRDWIRPDVSRKCDYLARFLAATLVCFPVSATMRRTIIEEEALASGEEIFNFCRYSQASNFSPIYT